MDIDRTMMLCTANTHHIVLQIHSLVHNTTSSGHMTGHFGHKIQRPFLREESHNFQAL